jgi:hypothetical protein
MHGHPNVRFVDLFFRTLYHIASRILDLLIIKQPEQQRSVDTKLLIKIYVLYGTYIEYQL